MKAGDTLL